ncbi:ABC transporter substrate-binding protein [Halomicrobium mukohataei]|uniref:Extracellular solute-binding protein family 1 n=2 Tax=Halomicrobium mukohataei TaxID=57705 RepID=C7P4T0_HALMD|nr:extracellular solute-binding protein [Halomicrobium mukohataei]ACV49325.1 extracellular solute-binding protein family 1 [Halomicrobium mukohataei DSM 12286]QCD67164.1 extracellular solute-binding protein [Halomicrobium mukohataei]
MTDQNASSDRRQLLKALGTLSVASMAGCISQSGSDGDGSGESGDGSTGSSGDGSTEEGGEATPVPMADSFSFWELSKTWGPHIERYESETDATVEHTNMGPDELLDNLQTRLLSGTGAPDAAMVEYTSLKQVAKTGGLRDVSDWIDEADIRDDFTSGIWEVVSDGDAVYEVPYDIGPATLFYRKDIWDEHGLSDDIETYDEFIEEGKKLPDDVSLLSLPGSGLSVFWRMMYRQLGGVEFDEEGRLAFDNDKAVQAMAQLQELADAGITDDTASWSQQWFAGFNEGTVTAYLSGAWFSGTLMSSMDEAAGDWRGMKIPALESGGTRASNIGGSGVCFPDQNDEATARRAFDFVVNTTTNVEEMANLFAEEGNISAYMPAWDDEAFENPREFFGGQALGTLWTDIADDIPPYRYTLDSPKIMNLLNPLLQDVVYGDLDPESALEEWVTQSANETGREVA